LFWNTKKQAVLLESGLSFISYSRVESRQPLCGEELFSRTVGSLQVFSRLTRDVLNIFGEIVQKKDGTELGGFLERS
jgi:hypothetical protein